MITRLLISFLFFSQLLLGQSDFLQSNWVGRLDISGESHFLRIQFRDGQTTLQLPHTDGTIRYELNHFEEKLGLPQFSIKRIVNDWHFRAVQADGGTLKGEVDRAGLKGHFYLHKVKELQAAAWQSYLGDFRTAEGKIFKVWDRFNTLRAHSPYSQEVSRMYAIDKDCFWLSTGELLKYNGDSNELRWNWGEQKAKANRLSLYTEEKQEVALQNGGTVGVSLFLPEGQGPFPAVLVARGAGNLDRSANYTEAEIFSSYGIATLIYDNYNTGKTTGDPRTKDFEDKQNLVLELYAYLQKQDKIKSDKIGLMGGSQGARIAAMAASTDIDPAFLILRAHPMETRKDQQLYAIGAFLRQRNVKEEMIVKALHLWDQYFELAYRQELDSAYIAAVAKMRAEQPDLMLPAAPSGQAPPFAWPDDIYDATMDYLTKVKCPVLSEHGVNDDRVPARKSVHFLEQSLAKAGNEDLTVVFYPNANHSFLMPGFRIAPGLFMNEVNWIKQMLGR